MKDDGAHEENEVTPDEVRSPPIDSEVVDPSGNVPIGIKGLSQAISNRAKCPQCQVAIAKGDWHVTVRFKASKRIADERRVHIACMSTLPCDVARTARKWLAVELRAADLTESRSVVLRQIQHTLERAEASHGDAS